jgi:hypothetical protein
MRSYGSWKRESTPEVDPLGYTELGVDPHHGIWRGGLERPGARRGGDCLRCQGEDDERYLKLIIRASGNRPLISRALSKG